LLVLLGACGGDDDGRDEPTAGPTASSDAARPAGDLPAGWTEQRVEGLRFGVPEGYEAAPVQRTDQGSRATFRSTDGAEVPARIDVFVETGQVGSLEIRGGLLRSRLQAELGAQMGEPEPVDVEGASDAEQFAYTYEIDTSTGRTSVRQVDLLVDRPSLPEYGIRYAATADAYDDEVWQQLRASLAVEDPADG
jgi:hypothetical protein